MFWYNWFISKPFNEGFLSEENGHKVYFAEFGNPEGQPVLVFNGGPGGSFRAAKAKYANLRKYRVIMFDQRGCGRSQPLGKLEYNTTADLLNDATRIVNQLNIQKKIILWGASWGSTLALLWAEAYPEKVAKLLLSQVFLANKEFIDWEFSGSQYIYPEFVAEMEQESQGNIKGYYNKLISSDNLKNQLQAVNKYGWFERICGSMMPQFSTKTELLPEELASQRVYMHYSAADFFLAPNQILDNITKIEKIETVIIHNRLDLICPFKAAYDISQRLTNSRLVVVPDFGHVSAKLHKTIQKEINSELN